MTSAQSLRRIFRWPAVMAGTSLIGLLSALIGDGAWDGLSWAMLAPPVVVSLFACRGRNKQQEPAR